MQCTVTYAADTCSQLPKVSSEIQTFDFGYPSSEHFVFTWARMWGSVVILRYQEGFACKKIVWEKLVIVHGILQKVALRYQEMAWQVTSLIQPYRLPAVSNVGRASSVGIATRQRLDDPGIKSRYGNTFRTRPERPWGPPGFLYNG